MRFICAMITLLCLAAVVQADELYLYDGVDAKTAKALFENALQEPVNLDKLVSISETVLPVDADIWFVGASPGDKCQSITRTELDETTGGSDAIEQLLLLAFENFRQDYVQDAAEQVAFIIRAIPCVHRAISKDVLARVYLYAGVIAFVEGRKDDAVRAFQISSELSGRPDWQDELPPSAKDTYLRAFSGREAFGRIDVGYRLRGLDLTLLLIDGDQLDVSQEASGLLRVLPGQHVVQWKRLDGELETRVVEVPVRALLLSTEGLRELLATPPGNSDANTVQESYFARQAGEVSVLLVDPESKETRVLYRYDGKGSAGGHGAIRYVLGAPKDLVNRQVPVRFSPFEGQIGASYVYVVPAAGVALGGRALFWFRPEFGVMFGGEFGVVPYLSDAPEIPAQIRLLLGARAGVRVGLRPKRLVNPYLFGDGHVLFGSDPVAMGGPEFGAGSAFFFKGAKPSARVAGVFCEAGGGVLFSNLSPRGSVEVTCGLTFRSYTLIE